MPKYQGDAYLRLSYSADRSVESDSIANQKKLIEDFVQFSEFLISLSICRKIILCLFLYDTGSMESTFILDKTHYFPTYDSFLTTLGFEPIFQGSEP